MGIYSRSHRVESKKVCSLLGFEPVKPPKIAEKDYLDPTMRLDFSIIFTKILGSKAWSILPNLPNKN